MNKRKNVYLSGPIENESNPNIWRKELEEEFPVYNFYNPCDEEYDNKHHMVIEQLRIVALSDFVLVNYVHDTETWGTPMEILWAYIKGIPIIVWTIENDEKIPDYLDIFSDYIHEDVERCLKTGWGYTT